MCSYTNFHTFVEPTCQPQAGPQPGPAALPGAGDRARQGQPKLLSLSQESSITLPSIPPPPPRGEGRLLLTATALISAATRPAGAEAAAWGRKGVVPGEREKKHIKKKKGRKERVLRARALRPKEERGLAEGNAGGGPEGAAAIRAGGPRPFALPSHPPPRGEDAEAPAPRSTRGRGGGGSSGDMRPPGVGRALGPLLALVLLLALLLLQCAGRRRGKCGPSPGNPARPRSLGLRRGLGPSGRRLSDEAGKARRGWAGGLRPGGGWLPRRDVEGPGVVAAAVAAAHGAPCLSSPPGEGCGGGGREGLAWAGAAPEGAPGQDWNREVTLVPEWKMVGYSGEVSRKVSSVVGKGGEENRFLSPGAAIWGGHSHALSEDWGIMRKFLLWLVLNLIFWSTLATITCLWFLFCVPCAKKHIKALRIRSRTLWCFSQVLVHSEMHCE